MEIHARLTTDAQGISHKAYDRNPRPITHWLGELWRPSYYDDMVLNQLEGRTHRWHASCKATSKCRVIAFSKQELHDLIELNPRMAAAASAAQLATVCAERRAANLNFTQRIEVKDEWIAELEQALDMHSPEEAAAISRRRRASLCRIRSSVCGK